MYILINIFHYTLNKYKIIIKNDNILYLKIEYSFVYILCYLDLNIIGNPIKIINKLYKNILMTIFKSISTLIIIN